MEQVIEAVLLATCHFPRLRHDKRMLPLPVIAAASAVIVVVASVRRIVVVVETLALSLSGRFRRHRRRRVVVAALEQHPLLAHNSLVAVNQSIWDVW